MYLFLGDDDRRSNFVDMFHKIDKKNSIFLKNIATYFYMLQKFINVFAIIWKGCKSFKIFFKNRYIFSMYFKDIKMNFVV